MSSRSSATLILQQRFRELNEHQSEMYCVGLVDNDVFHWRVTLFGPPDSLYAGGIYPAELIFKDDFPYSPPEMYFKYPMHHVNIDAETGKVCISTLHNPGDDPTGYEDSGMRWLPSYSIDAILQGVLSILSEPNWESVYNVAASRDHNTDPKAYARKVRKLARDSAEC